jgi:DNA-binding response OmpR family regulator
MSCSDGRRAAARSGEMLARDVWKEPRRATPLDNVIDVKMTRLRKKVDFDGPARLIHTVRRVGFVLREGEVLASPAVIRAICGGPSFMSP